MSEEAATPGATPGSDAMSEQDGQEQSDGATPPTGDEALGEAGKAALERERKRANDAERELKRLRDANLSDQERAQRELDELRQARDGWSTERREMRLQMHVAEAARQLGFVDPTDAYALLNRDGVEYGEDDVPMNVASLLRKLADAKPHLVTQPATAANWGTGAVGRPSDSSGDMNALLRRAAGH